MNPVRPIGAALVLAATITTATPADAQPEPPPPTLADVIVWGTVHDTYFRCLRWRESDRSTASFNPDELYMGGAKNKNPDSTASGFFQWLNSSWKNAALAIGRSDIAHRPAREASPYDQFLVTGAYFIRNGAGPWAKPGSICGRYL